MVRLSIVVPVLDDVERFESSLVAILTHRPPHSEVLVVLSRPYADPYALGDEVRFVEAGADAGWVESVNAGVHAATASIVNVLTPGVEVREGWSAAVLRHFDDPRVASVVPLVLDAREHARVVAAGVGYRVSGRRCLVGVGLSASAAVEARLAPVGPTQVAGFYRKSALNLIGGFDPAVGDRLADIDLALRLRYAGFACVCEPHSQAWADGDTTGARTSMRQARAAERLFWRSFGVRNAALSLVSHAGLVGREFVENLPRPAAAGAILARFAAALDLGAHVRFHHRLKRLKQQAAIALAIDESDQRRTVRFDPAHAAWAGRASRRAAARRLAA